MQALTIQSEEEKIKSWIYFACQSNGVHHLFDKIVFRFDKRFTRILGRAFPQSKLIELSAPLWKRANESQRKQVVIHETCHIIAYHKHGLHIKAHGNEWKNCMTEAGAKPIRCHDVSRDGLRKQYIKYAVQCECNSVWIGHVKAAKVRAGRLSCGRCKKKLQLTGQEYRPKNLLT